MSPFHRDELSAYLPTTGDGKGRCVDLHTLNLGSLQLDEPSSMQ